MQSILAGEAACLTAAFLWALSLTMFRGPIEAHGARTVNLVKCVIAATLQGITVLALGKMSALAAASTYSLSLIALSGLVGLVLGDTALFAAVARIGVHRTLLLQTLAPVFTALIAFAWQNERLTPMQAGGAAMILAGVGLVVAPRRTNHHEDRTNGGAATVGAWAIGGIVFGVVAAFGQGAGVVLAKVGMLDVPVLPASFLRLSAAAAGLIVIAAAAGRLRGIGPLLRSRPEMTRVIPATLMGSYIALFLMMAGVAFAPASVAAVLLSTGPVFSLFLEAILEKRPVEGRNLLGTAVAVAGVAVLSAG